MLIMKNSKLLAKSITLGLILAMPYAVVNASEYSDSTITGWGGANGGTLNNGDISNNIIVTNNGNGQACQIVNVGATANGTILTGNSEGTGGRQDVYGKAVGTIAGQNAQVFVRGGEAVSLQNNGATVLIGGQVGENYYDGKVTNMTMSSGSVALSNGSLEKSIVNDGTISLYDGKLTSTQVFGGTVNVSGGEVDTIKLAGNIENSKKLGLNLNGGTATNVTVADNVFISINGAAVSNLTVDGAKSDIGMKSGSLKNVSLKGIDQENTSGMGIDGGEVQGLTVDSYGVVTVNGGEVTNTTIKTNGWQGVKNNAVVENTTIESGGRQTVYENATSINVTVNTGAELVINENANAKDVTSDGMIYMRDGAQLTGNTELKENSVIDLGGIVNGLFAEDKLSGREESGKYSIENLKSDGGNINIFYEDQNLTIDKLTGDELNITTNVVKDSLITIADNQNANLNITGTSEVTNAFNGNDIVGSMQELADTISVKNDNELKNVIAEEGDILGKITARTDKNGNIIVGSVKQGENIKNMGISELANVALMAWRAENDEMHQRMGELRSSTGEAGIWALPISTIPIN